MGLCVKPKDAEKTLQENEKLLGMRTTEFTKFLYTAKRYGYKDIPFDDRIFAALSGDMGIDYSQFDNETEEDRNKF